MLLSLLLFAAADAAVPKPGPIKTFGDWSVACDNVSACEMTSLIPEQELVDGSDSGASFSISRTAGPAGGFSVDIASNGGIEGAVSVRIDGRAVGGGAVRKDSLTLTGDAAVRIVAAITGGKRLTLTDAAGKELAHASLAGSSAALRFIDAEQGRAGTVTAAVAKGAKSAAAVPPSPAIPRVPSLAAPGTTAPIGPALLKAMIALSECDPEDVKTSEKLEASVLGGGKTLVLLPCGAGAYNFISVAFVVTGGKPGFARFDLIPGWSEAAGKPMLVNADWDATTAQLRSFGKGRGMGDCGSAETYAWDGAMFRLIEATRMEDCRGSVNWLTVWRATPVR
jgi:hypothetical protein